MTAEIGKNQASRLPLLFESLAGEWKLERNLHSTNTSEPSGKCYGQASFTSRSSAPVLQEGGKLDFASAEMLYHEQGEFELPNAMKLPFSKKYVWRLNQEPSEISVWFAKPGDDGVDYLFHKIQISSDLTELTNESKQFDQVHGSGGHLCDEDFYSTSYTFTFDTKESKIVAWESLHEVRGPKKDQLIFTKFTKHNTPAA